MAAEACLGLGFNSGLNIYMGGDAGSEWVGVVRLCGIG